jgi:branched-chain amino acid transport system permease protein
MTATRAALLMGAAAALLAPFVVYPVLLMTILCLVVFACSFNLLLGYAGLLCFGHAMFFGSAAYITGYLLKTTKLSPELGMPLVWGQQSEPLPCAAPVFSSR